ncbi:serine/threonine-protein kinase [Kribbella sp. CA-253562]|uniref:serine/threonine-protein kinase n=1 Tax=Kribbella sp. CA-253562 TaxID=3239942 RepID=UPI003D89FA93
MGNPLGRGGMGEVFQATDELLGRQVALKLLLPTRRDPEMAARFHREARAAAALSDPHVVAAYDFGSYDGGYFLVMELVAGRTVAEELRLCGPFDADRALAVIKQSATGLAAAHAEDIVHRDVKPQNLLITPDGTVKVTDFGIARFLTDTTTTVTANGQILGTSYFLAPERARGEPAGKASDVYALGCVLYQLVTGHPPFQGDQPAGVMYQHVTTEPTPPSELRPELGGEFERLLMSMLAKNPADRPTAAQIASGTTVQPVVTGELVVPPSRRWSQRRLAGVVAGMGVVAATATGVVLDNQDQRLPETTNLTPPQTPRSTPTTPPSSKPAPTRPPSTTPNDDQQVSTTTERVADPPTSGKPSSGEGNSGKPGKPGDPGNGKSKGKNKKS